MNSIINNRCCNIFAVKTSYMIFDLVLGGWSVTKKCDPKGLSKSRIKVQFNPMCATWFPLKIKCQCFCLEAMSWRRQRNGSKGCLIFIRPIFWFGGGFRGSDGLCVDMKMQEVRG